MKKPKIYEIKKKTIVALPGDKVDIKFTSYSAERITIIREPMYLYSGETIKSDPEYIRINTTKKKIEKYIRDNWDKLDALKKELIGEAYILALDHVKRGGDIKNIAGFINKTMFNIKQRDFNELIKNKQYE